MRIAKLLNPKLDYVFKRIFGSVGSEKITKSFIEAVTKEKIADIKLDCNPITEKDLYEDKISILDIKAKLNNNTNCNIEMQIVDRKNIEKRLLYYWSKMYTSSIKKGQDFDKLEKGIVILISDYNIEKLSKIEKYITKWQIREEDTPKVILTDVLEIYIIELRKASKDLSDSKLNAWLKFINNPEEKSNMTDSEELIEARRILEDISSTERERYLAEQREKWIMDKHAIHAAGYDKGLQAGINKEKLEMAKKMKKEGVELSFIIKITGLTKEEIEKL